MNLEAILNRLRIVRRNGSGWMATCPAHEDGSPSLSIREENGKTLLHCFAGCSVKSICDAVRIEVRDLFNEPHMVPSAKPLVVRHAEKQIASLRSRLTPRDRERNVTGQSPRYHLACA